MAAEHTTRLPTRRFNVDERHKMAEAGILSRDELVNGETVETPGHIPASQSDSFSLGFP